MVILLRRLLSTDSGPASVDAEAHEPCSAAARKTARIVPAVLTASVPCFSHAVWQQERAGSGVLGSTGNRSKPGGWAAAAASWRLSRPGSSCLGAGSTHAERPVDEWPGQRPAIAERKTAPIASPSSRSKAWRALVKVLDAGLAAMMGIGHPAPGPPKALGVVAYESEIQTGA
jgi:hypothetical protein